MDISQNTMQPEHQNLESIEFPLVSGGYVNSFARRFAQPQLSVRRRLHRVALIICVTYLPLFVLSVIWGHAVAGNVDIPLLHDPALFGRFLFVLPVLELAEAIVAISLPVQVRHFLDSDIISERDRPHFDAARQLVVKLRSSVKIEWFLAILAFALAIIFRVFVIQSTSTSWEHIGFRTPAGWWYALISLPILYFFLLRWMWIFILWGWFLFLISRLNLQLTPTHPDRSGGLGFLGWGLACFSTVLMALSAMFSSAFFYQILHKNESLDTLKYHIIVYVVITVTVIHLPLLVFLGRLSSCRFRGLLEFSSLVLRYDRAFEEKWIEKRDSETTEPMLGSPDMQSLADIATAYEHINEMLLFPFDSKGSVALIVATILPMAPLLLTSVPMNEILAKLAELMV